MEIMIKELIKILMKMKPKINKNLKIGIIYGKNKVPIFLLNILYGNT